MTRMKTLGIWTKKFFYFSWILLFSLAACTSVDEESQNEKPPVNTKNEASTNPSLVNFNGKTFSVPSPFQIAYLVKETNIPYNNRLLNAVDNLPNYISEFEKATNLGVYGANLGYLTVYDQLPEAAKYFSAIRTLTSQLNMENAIDPALMSRLEQNMNNKDSLLQLVSTTYRSTDSYLMNNERNMVATCILAGAWVESLYILTQLSPEAPSKEVLDRIGEQKYTLENLMELLRPHYGQGNQKYDEMANKLIDLATVFDGVTIEYTYNQPIVDVQNKTTTVMSTSHTVISDYQLTAIKEATIEIRNLITK